MKKAIFVLYFLLFFCRSLFADVAIFAYLNKNKITIGDNIKLTINLEYTNDVKISSAVFENNLKNFEIKDYKFSQGRKKYVLFGRYVKKYEYLLSTFTTGIYPISPFSISFTNPAGIIAQAQTQPLKIEVVSLLDKESVADIKDIKPPVNVKSKSFLYLLSILLLIFLAIFLQKFFHKDLPSVILSEIIDPYKYAVGELAKLESANLIKEGKIKEFFIILTRIVRIYLSKIFEVDIIDMTTSEAIRALREKNADKKFLMDLREFFNFADLVKFAKYIPDEKETIFNLETAKNLIESVRPLPPKISETKNGVKQ
ncbi:MAG: hypothetical protein COS68_02270 [Elusimicrobia bacterium CG06_land_8_20_14_3_00_38_11]|nr:MAG: hypothetical protein COS68_02270 [Elusimicrobia bacterium CG06_land_8_20_14_3_00_38_11]